MTLGSATKLGPYEILEPIGAGGMGEVYRARDTRLDRIVAIKVLPSHLSSNPDLRQRFEREARAVSSLNHPHICTLHDIGSQNGTDYIVMEFIEGETLSSRLKNGSLPRQDLLRYGIQIADALDKAHRQGIVHRDLKPGNIILTKSGAKLLDFGLAKLRSESKSRPDVSTLPTEHRDLTQEGMVLGTFQYMAPEQLEGKDADHRTDIFALGAVLYEMATGKKAFEGKSQASLIAAILKEEPKPISELQPLTPPILERLIKNCLAKDPEDRWQSAHDISKELRWISEGSDTTQLTSVASVSSTKGRNRASLPGWIVAAGLLLALSGLLLLFYPKWLEKPRKAVETQFSIDPEPGSTFLLANQADPDFAISPDGTKLVYLVASANQKDQLWLRSLSSVSTQPIAGTESARMPFWSPDAENIAFASGTRLVKVPLSGGTPQVICDLHGEFRGGDWLPDGTILFATMNNGLQRVSSEGGEPKLVTQLDTTEKGIGHSWPAMLPDNKHFLFLNDFSDPTKRAIYVGSLDSKEPVRLMKTQFMAQYLDPGYLLYIQAGSLVAQKLEMDPPRLTGDPIRIVDPELPINVLRGAAPITSSLNGTIAFRVSGIFQKTQLYWFDRNGKNLGTVGPVGSYVSLNLSPDGKRAAITALSEIGRSIGRAEVPVNIWVIDLVRGVQTRVTFDPSTSDENPTWSPDGRWLTFASHRNAEQAKIYRKPATGEGQEQSVWLGTGNEHPIDWSPDGKYLLVHSAGNYSDLDLMYLVMSEPPEKKAFLNGSGQEVQGQFSPGGNWVAYTSEESGRQEVYVRRFPSGEAKWQISSGGGEPRWRSDGKELFYISLDGKMMSVAIKPGDNFEASPPVPLFSTNLGVLDPDFYGGSQRYDVTADGSRFLVNTVVVAGTPPSMHIITNWTPSR
ncbi:protein kinase [bacterium]|nr:protein kinase [bacterium]